MNLSTVIGIGKENYPEKYLFGGFGCLECENDNDPLTCKLHLAPSFTGLPFCMGNKIENCQWPEIYDTYFLNPFYTKAEREGILNTIQQKTNSYPTYVTDEMGFKEQWRNNMD